MFHKRSLMKPIRCPSSVNFTITSLLLGILSLFLLAPQATAHVSTASLDADQATDASYIKEMPDPARVLADIHGSDNLDTAARQTAALEILSDIIESLARTEGFNLRETPEERELNGRYVQASSNIKSATVHILDPKNWQFYDANSPRAKWNQLVDQYRANDTFIRELLQRYLSPPNRDRYLEISGPRMAVFRAAQAAKKARQVTAPPGLPRPASDHGTGFDLLVAGFGLLLMWGIFGEFKQHGLIADNSFKLNGGHRLYNLNTVTGFVKSPTKSQGTFVSRSTDSSGHVTFSSTTYVDDQFFIAYPEGEMSVQVRNVDIAVREGHIFSAVWAIPKGKKSGNYLLFRNHTTNEQTFMETTLHKILYPKTWLLFVFLVLVWAYAISNTIAINTIAVHEYGDLVNYHGGEAALKFNQFADLYSPLLRGVEVTCAAAVAWIAIWAILGGLRERRFKSSVAGTLVGILDGRAKERAGSARPLARPA
jgi:hypothetical protein